MPTVESPPRDTLREQLAATLSISLLVLDLAQHAEATDSVALTEIACLIAAMHAQLAATDPARLTNAWGFVEALRALHRARDGRHESLAGFLAGAGGSLAALLAPTNLEADHDGALSCHCLGALAGGGDLH